MDKRQVIVIGGGPAGYTAALYASRAGLDTLVIEKISVGGQMTLTDIIDNILAYMHHDAGTNGAEHNAQQDDAYEHGGHFADQRRVLVGYSYIQHPFGDFGDNRILLSCQQW